MPEGGEPPVTNPTAAVPASDDAASERVRQRVSAYGRTASRRARWASAAILLTSLGCLLATGIAADRTLLLETATRRWLLAIAAAGTWVWIRREGWYRDAATPPGIWAEILERSDPSWGGALRLATGAEPRAALTPLIGTVEKKLLAVGPETYLPRRPLIVPVACAAAAWAVLGAGFAVSGTLRTGLVRFLPFSDPRWTRIVSLSAPESVGRGDAVVIELHAEGILPDEAFLHVHEGPDLEAGGLRAVGEDGRYRFRIGQLLDPLEYSIRIGDNRTERRFIRILDRPHLLSLEADVAPPPYSGLPASRGPIDGPLRVVQGTSLVLRARFNKPMRSVGWEGTGAAGTGGEDRVALREEAGTGSAGTGSAGTGVAGTWTWSGTMTAPRRGILRITDVDGLTSDRPIPLSVEVVPDLPPEVTLQRPRTTDRLVTPAGTLRLVFQAKDDFGLGSVEVATVGSAENSTPRVERVAGGDNLPNPWAGEHVWRPGEPAPSPGDVLFVVVRAADRSPLENVGESARLRLRVVTPDTLTRHIDERLLGTRHRLEGTADRIVILRERLRSGGDLGAARLESITAPTERAKEDLAEILEEISDNRIEAFSRLDLIRGALAALDQKALPALSLAAPEGTTAERAGEAFDEAHTHIREALRLLAAWEDLAGITRQFREILQDQEGILRDFPPGGTR